MRVLASHRTFLAFLVAMGVGCGGGSGETADPSQGDNDADVDGSTNDAEPSDDAATSDSTADDTAIGDTGSDEDTAVPDTGTPDDAGDADTCPPPCGLGTKVCDGNAVRTCEAVGECTAWSAPVACPAGTACTAGACETSCTDACPTLGAKQCDGSSAVRECVTAPSGCKEWSAPVACGGSLVCSGGSCVASCTDECVAGAKKCAGPDSYQVCEMQPSGCLDWSVSSLCAGGGSCTGAGVCVPCTTGAKRCGATGNVETCSSGAWTETATCSFGCTAGECNTTITCTPGNYRCNGLAVEVCNASGTAYLHTSTCAVGCSDGLCVGGCTPGAKRCNAGKVETCNATGTAWTVTETCDASCDPTSVTCVLPSLDVTTNTQRDGVLVVDGEVRVRNGATLSSPTGNLTIRAKSIVVDLGGSIAAAPTGDDAALNGANGTTAGCTGNGGAGGKSAGGAADAVVGPGGKGGKGGIGCSSGEGGPGGYGGGVIRLIADTIVISGSVTANGANGTSSLNYYAGGGGGGAGGGILVAAEQITLTGSLSAAGGTGGAKYTSSSYSVAGADGAPGRVKILYGDKSGSLIGGTITGNKTEGMMPPLAITSSTHPVQTLFYNDDFPHVAFAWERPWASRFGYYLRLSTKLEDVPTPATGTFLDAEVVSYERSKFVSGNNWLHFVSIDPASNVGTVENRFLVQVNTTPPTVTSSSHSDSKLWYENSNPFFSWTVPNGDANYQGFHYVFDQYGDTVPTLSDAFLPITQKSKIQPGVPDGIWAMHVVSKDTHGYLTKNAGHYVVRIGANPGTGNVLGSITSSAGGTAIGAATVTINRGLLRATTPDATTNASGAYNMSNVPAGTWELTVSRSGYKTKTVPFTVTKDASTTVNVVLDP